MFEFHAINILIGIGKVLLVLLPIPLAYIAYHMWLHYIQEEFVSGIEWQLLEIIMPQAVNKTPLAMETILANAMYQRSEKEGFDKYWLGHIPMYFSLEIVSLEGKIHFYINTPSRIAPLIKSQVYAQYPQAKVLEVEDYVHSVPKIGKDTGWGMWGTEWKLAKPDPFPIRTYIEYGLDKIEKDPSQQVDPLVSLIEYMSNIGPGEHIWTQLIIRYNKKTYGGSHGHDYNKEAEIELQKLVDPYTEKKEDESGKVLSMQVRPPDYLKDEIQSISDKQHKLLFECGLRTLYIAKSEVFDAQKRRALRMMYNQYNSSNFNSIVRVNSTGGETFDDVLVKRKNRMLNWYRSRNFFHPAWYYAISYPFPLDMLIPSNPPVTFVLNTEEIATLFHFPAGVTATPSIKRVETTTSKAPTNLPT